eukprot:7250796-Pyramimonas_sp.AAC.1
MDLCFCCCRRGQILDRAAPLALSRIHPRVARAWSNEEKERLEWNGVSAALLIACVALAVMQLQLASVGKVS